MRPSIITGALKARALATEESGGRPWTVKVGRNVLTLRKCMRGDALSGGIALDLDGGKRYAYRSSLNVGASTRLRPGWTEKTLDLAIRRLWHRVREQEVIDGAREGLYIAVEKLPQAEQDKLSAKGDAASIPVDYESMTLEHVAFYQEQMGL